jgi:hypothetical protein
MRLRSKKLENFPHNILGDQIGRIFAYWMIIYFGHLRLNLGAGLPGGMFSNQKYFLIWVNFGGSWN